MTEDEPIIAVKIKRLSAGLWLTIAGMVLSVVCTAAAGYARFVVLEAKVDTLKENVNTLVWKIREDMGKK